MARDLRYRIDMPYVNTDGTIEVIDTDFISDYPFTWQYKLYETYEENMKRLHSILYSVYPEKFELTPRFQAYVDDRMKYFDKVADYRTVVEDILSSSLPVHTKKEAIRKVDQILNILYPYAPPNET